MQVAENKGVEQYWLSKFSARIEDFDLPWESPASSVSRQRSELRLSNSLSGDILNICKNSELALLTYFSAAFSVILRQYLAQEEVVFCGAVQQFLIPFRFLIDDQTTYTSLLEQAKDNAVNGIPYASYPYLLPSENVAPNNNAFERVTKKIGIVYNPDTSLSAVDFFDFCLSIQYSGDEFICRLHYHSSDKNSIIVRYFHNALIELLTKVKEIKEHRINSIDLLTTEQRNKLVHDFNPIYKENLASSFNEQFELCVQTYPHQRALVSGSEQLTYSELNRLAGRVAYELNKLELQREDIVAVYLDRSVDMVVALLGVLKSGGSFLPVDPEYPSERIDHILNDSKARFIITSTRYLHQFEGRREIILIDHLDRDGEVLRPVSITPGQLAYIIYTSGTTGKPNGVMIGHRALINLCTWHNRYYEVSSDDVTTKYAAFGFDATVWEIFPPLLNGACLYIIEDEIRHNVTDLNKSLTKHSVTMAFLPTQLGEEFMKVENRVLRKLLLGGDKLRWINEQANYKIYNNYGPTENTVVTTAGEINFNSPNITIGKPIDNTKIFILSVLNGDLAPIGAAGELCISGESLARGYYNNDALTARKFIENEFSGPGKLYRTGDQARWLVDGNIEFIGRVDTQIKIRGYRIEVEEIEKALLRCPPVENAVVVKKEEAEGRSMLCAYFTGKNDIDTAYLKKFLTDILPDYMIPSQFIRIERIPVTQNGKADKAFLSKKEEIFADNSVTYSAPGNEIEKLVQTIWQDVLTVSPIGIDDNFFVLGGDSIMAIQIESRLLNYSLSLKNAGIFDFPNIRALASKLIKHEQQSSQHIVTGQIPLSPIQGYFFANKCITHKNHYNQALMLEFDHRLDFEHVKKVFGKLVAHHDALGIIFKVTDEGIVQENTGSYMPAIGVIDVSVMERQDEYIQNECQIAQRSIKLNEGLIKILLFQLPGASKIAIVIHHLVIDGVSWRILLNDLDTLFGQVIKSQDISLPLKTHSFKQFAEKMRAPIISPEEREYWEKMEAGNIAQLFAVDEHVSNKVANLETLDITLTADETNALLHKANKAYNTGINHLLVSALAVAIEKEFGTNDILIWMEGHGREKAFVNQDITRTVGWFTTIYPVRIELGSTNVKDVIIAVKDNINRIPNNGIGYGVWARSEDDARDAKFREITFNYLGQFDGNVKNKLFQVSTGLIGDNISPENSPESELEIIGIIVEGQLKLTLRYNPLRAEADQFKLLAHYLKESLKAVIDHCSLIRQPVVTATDFTYKDLPFETVAKLTQKLPVADIYLLSPAQEGMLFYSLLDDQSLSYYEKFKYEVKSNFIEKVVLQTLDLLFERYDILRTVFYHENLNRPIQVVLKKALPEHKYQDLSGYSGDINKIINADDDVFSNRGFGLANDVLLRLRVIKMAEGRCHFQWTFHHIIMDGWSAVLLCTEFHRLYEQLAKGTYTGLPAVNPYKDYIKWLGTKGHSEAQEFWSAYLKGLSQLTPIMHGAQKIDAYVFTETSIVINSDITKKLFDVASVNQITVSSVLQCAWALLLGRYNNCNDVVFGKVVSGRSPEIPGVEQIIGPFINTIPVYIKNDPEETFLSFAQRMQKNALKCDDYSYQSLTEIQKNTGFGERLLDHIFVFENYPISNNASLLDIALENVNVFEQTNYNFNIVAIPGQELKIVFRYNANAFEPYFVQGVKNSLARIIEQIKDNFLISLKDISLVSESDKKRLLVEFNRANPNTSETTFLALFNKQVRLLPHRKALIFNDGQITYAELGSRSDKLAKWLMLRGAFERIPVGILIDKSIDMIVGLLAILKTGSPFVPIAPDYPEARIQHILKDSGVSIVFSEKKYRSKFHSDIEIVVAEDHALWSDNGSPAVGLPEPGDLAYIIYTSGTTGLPNGVEVDHRALATLCEWHNRFYHISTDDISTKYAGLGFDATVWEVFPVLVSGGGLYITEEQSKYDIDGLNKNYHRYGVTVSFLPTSIGERFMWLENKILKKLLLGGDKLKLINENAGYEIYNNYGPTENSVVTTAGRVSGNAKNISIGKPIDTAAVRILCRGTSQMQPIGVAGEICISGNGLARGYLRNEKLTSAKFVRDPFNNDVRIYRTGDLGRWLPDGHIEFLGRLDDQVSVRGYRIELGEIENCLLRHKYISDCTVMVDENNNGHNILYAFYTSNQVLPTNDLKMFLANSLPFFMIPSFLIRIKDLPLNPNGKIDRTALKVFASLHEKSSHENSAADATEQAIANVWAKVLGLDGVGRSDNFFDLGGTSLDMINVCEILNRTYKADNLLMQMFSYPTVNLLAGYLNNVQNNIPARDSLRLRADGNEVVKNNRLKQRQKRNVK